MVRMSHHETCGVCHTDTHSYADCPKRKEVAMAEQEKAILIVEVDGVPVRMRQDTPEPKPLVGACAVQDVYYVREAQLVAEREANRQRAIKATELTDALRAEVARLKGELDELVECSEALALAVHNTPGLDLRPLADVVLGRAGLATAQDISPPTRSTPEPEGGDWVKEKKAPT